MYLISTPLEKEYNYEITDHLGSVRAVIKNNTAEILLASNYHPFGEIRDQLITGYHYRNGYQGSFAEKDEETGYDNFELRMLDTELGRFFTPDPYNQYHSPYASMGNNPISQVDPDGGWSSLSTAVITGALIGGAVGGYIGQKNGNNMRQTAISAIGGAIIGGALGYGANYLFATPPSTGSNVIRIGLDVGNGGANGGDWGGHVGIVIPVENEQSVMWNFTSDNENIINGLLNKDRNNDKRNLFKIPTDTWHSKGVMKQSGADYPFDFTYDVFVSNKQYIKIINEINKIRLNPPDYRTVGARCASVASRVLRAGKVIAPGSKLFEWSPRPLNFYLKKALK